MFLAFKLSMPGSPSWNGKWSGDGMPFFIVKNLGPSVKMREKGDALIGDYGYVWPDGWRANVSVREVDASEARRLRANSRGFAGYDWMVESLLACGEIRI